MKIKKIIVYFTITIQSTAFAQPLDSLNHYLQIAAENNPGVQSAFSLYQASLQKVPQAAAWQDPTLEMSFFLQPMELVEGKQVADFKLMQMFPWFGTRKAARTEMQAMAKMAYEQFRETRDQLWLDIYTQWFTLCQLQQQLKNNQENKVLLTQLEELALQKFASGNNASASGERKMEKGEKNNTAISNSMSGMNMSNVAASPISNSQFSTFNSQSNMSMGGSSSSGMSEVLRIQLEMAEIDNNIESLQSEILAGKAKFNALLNRHSNSEIQVPDTLAQIPFLLDETAVLAQIRQQNPMLAMLSDEESAHKAKAEMDKKMSYPMFGIGLQYMLINKRENGEWKMEDDGMGNMSENTMSSMNGKDMIMPMISISIPIYRGKYKAQQRESQYRQQASREKYADTLNQLTAELHRLKSDLENAARKIALYRKQSVLAQTTYNLVIQEFATGKSDLTNVIQVQRQLLDYKLKAAEAIADYNTKIANIQKLISSNEE
ncbi:MAG: TolC family protein [Dysgonamonadaceae bacterium]|jgi:outer membrane protein TolC|nr:TolC family protein [Dysgonamonadaceae bacterium]